MITLDPANPAPDYASARVLVVGAGPVGLTLAAELARYRVPLRVIDKAPAPTDKSKALILWARSLELLDAMGCGATFVERGLKCRAFNIAANGKALARLRLDGIDSPHDYGLLLPQSETERLLDAQLRAMGGHVERQTELSTLQHVEDGVETRLRYADGRIQAARFDWVIGCDGAHSTVRHALGLDFPGSSAPTIFALADIELTGANLPRDEISMFFHADGILALFPMLGDRMRVIADLGQDINADARFEQSDLQALLDRRGPPGLGIGATHWLSHFRVNERQLTRYRHGRVLLAGDAAHVHSPAGGQGMNTGIQDAANLAWKLALVVHGRAQAEPLLSSYHAERHPVAAGVIRDTGRILRAALLRNAGARWLRDHAIALGGHVAPAMQRLATKFSELDITYSTSPLSGEHGAGHGPRPGDRVPGAWAGWLASPLRQPCFTLIGAAAPTIQAGLPEFWRDLLQPGTGHPAAPGLWLIRPDGYVACSAKPRDAGPIRSWLDALGGAAAT